MNLIVIKGRLVRDPELRTTQSGISVCNATVAVDRSYKRDGEPDADFFDCVFWKQGAEFVSKYFTKGKEILVQGSMQSRKYQDKNGNNRVAWEIQNAHAEFCGSKSDNGGGQGYTTNGTPGVQPPAQPVGGSDDFAVIEDGDDLPF